VLLPSQDAKTRWPSKKSEKISDGGKAYGRDNLKIPAHLPPGAAARKPNIFNEFWRRRWDSNPRYAFTAYNGLANRRLQPLGHPSAAEPGIPDRDKAHKGCKREGKAFPPGPL
jgi:hypothetical protein